MINEGVQPKSAPSAVATTPTGGRLLWPDIVSGLCVAGLLLPEAVAYAGLAHVQVAHALTATIVGLTLYALFGRNRFAIVTPTSSTATLSVTLVQLCCKACLSAQAFPPLRPMLLPGQSQSIPGLSHWSRRQ